MFEPLYFFMNEEVVLVEVKRLDLQETTDKSKIYHWIKISPEQAKVTPLVFKSMSEEIVNGNPIQIRDFAKGELRFDEHFAKFQHDGAGHIVANRPVSEIPKELSQVIQGYLEKIK